MTDKDGSDLHEHEHDPAGHDHEHMEAEAWQDEQPPPDDFDDVPAETAEEAGEAAAQTAGADANAQKKGSKLIPLIAVAGGMLFLGAMVYIQFFSGSSAPQPRPLPKTASAPSVPGVPSAPAAAPTASASSTSTEDITNLKSQAPAPSGPQIPGPSESTVSSAVSGMPSVGVAQPTPSIPTPNELVPPTTTPPPQPATPPQVAQAPVPSVSPQPVTSGVSVVPTQRHGQPNISSAATATLPAPTSAPASATASPAVEARMADLASRVDALQKSLDAASQQMAQIANAVSAPSAAPSPEIENRLNHLEQSIDQLQHKAPAATPVVSHAKMPTQHAMAKTHHHKAAAKHGHKKTVAHKKASTKAASHVAKSHWVLRAATPGEAWVATSADSAELHHVQVGDELPGVGTVTAITQGDSGWVVQGTSGAVK
jgi:hypothetical protein